MLLKDKNDLLKTLLHELQHKVQVVEHFAEGTSPETVWNQLSIEHRKVIVDRLVIINEKNANESGISKGMKEHYQRQVAMLKSGNDTNIQRIVANTNDVYLHCMKQLQEKLNLEIQNIGKI